MPLIRFARRLMLVVAADALVLETMANPVGNTTLPVYSGAVLPASVSSITSSNNVMNVVQAGNRAVINWESFSIGAAARLVINQPKGSVLINVAGGGASQINGAISGGLVGSTYGATNGAVWIINPSGLIFGTGSTVNVNSLLVSTLTPDLSDPSAFSCRSGQRLQLNCAEWPGDGRQHHRGKPEHHAGLDQRTQCQDRCPADRL
jgi:filamentous hemagglutinin family protein